MRGSLSLVEGNIDAAERAKTARVLAALEAAPWGLAAVVSSQALLLGVLAASGKIPPVVFKIFRALLTF